VTDEQIARLCHEANRAWCDHIGEAPPQPAWEDAPEWQRMSMMDGVLFHSLNPGAGDSAAHDNWLKLKTEEGWVWGPVKDPELKQHPCMVPFEQLPSHQQFKDKLFRTIVRTALESTHG
jgi:hypothetical protein